MSDIDGYTDEFSAGSGTWSVQAPRAGFLNVSPKPSEPTAIAMLCPQCGAEALHLRITLLGGEASIVSLTGVTCPECGHRFGWASAR